MLTLYSATWCSACQLLKQQLDESNIKYTEKLLDDESIVFEAQALGIKSIPTVIIDNELPLVNPTVKQIINAISISSDM